MHEWMMDIWVHGRLDVPMEECIHAQVHARTYEMSWSPLMGDQLYLQIYLELGK